MQGFIWAVSFHKHVMDLLQLSLFAFLQVSAAELMDNLKLVFFLLVLPTGEITTLSYDRFSCTCDLHSCCAASYVTSYAAVFTDPIRDIKTTPETQHDITFAEFVFI